LNIQIIGKKKCQDTKKAERFFKERGLKIHKLDVMEKALSPGELRNILSRVKARDLIDEDSKLYKQKFAFLDFDAEEEILEHPGLLKTPVVRCDGQVSVGYDPETWKRWID